MDDKDNKNKKEEDKDYYNEYIFFDTDHDHPMVKEMLKAVDKSNFRLHFKQL